MTALSSKPLSATLLADPVAPWALDVSLRT
jgi:hypothetical protein